MGSRVAREGIECEGQCKRGRWDRPNQTCCNITYFTFCFLKKVASYLLFEKMSCNPATNRSTKIRFLQFQRYSPFNICTGQSGLWALQLLVVAEIKWLTTGTSLSKTYLPWEEGKPHQILDNPTRLYNLLITQHKTFFMLIF